VALPVFLNVVWETNPGILETLCVCNNLQWTNPRFHVWVPSFVLRRITSTFHKTTTYWLQYLSLQITFLIISSTCYNIEYIWLDVIHTIHAPDQGSTVAGLFSVSSPEEHHERRTFADVVAIQERVTAVLWSIPKEAFADSFQKLYERCQQCIVKDGVYFEGQ
jgi:hypothetical protein